MTFLTAILGSFTLDTRYDQVVPGSDSGWNLQPGIQQSHPLGSDRDSILTMYLGSKIRNFTLATSPARFVQLALLMTRTLTFTDWTGDTRTVYVKTVARQQGSRPFLVIAAIELVSQ